MNQRSQRMKHQQGSILYIVLHSIRTSKSLLSMVSINLEYKTIKLFLWSC